MGGGDECLDPLCPNDPAFPEPAEERDDGGELDIECAAGDACLPLGELVARELLSDAELLDVSDPLMAE